MTEGDVVAIVARKLFEYKYITNVRFHRTGHGFFITFSMDTADERFEIVDVEELAKHDEQWIKDEVTDVAERLIDMRLDYRKKTGFVKEPHHPLLERLKLPGEETVI